MDLNPRPRIARAKPQHGTVRPSQPSLPTLARGGWFTRSRNRRRRGSSFARAADARAPLGHGDRRAGLPVGTLPATHGVVAAAEDGAGASALSIAQVGARLPREAGEWTAEGCPAIRPAERAGRRAGRHRDGRTRGRDGSARGAASSNAPDAKCPTFHLAGLADGNLHRRPATRRAQQPQPAGNADGADPVRRAIGVAWLRGDVLPM